MSRASVIRELGRPVAFYPGLARILGIEETLFFVQLMYWGERTDNAEQWVFKSADEWESEIALTYRQQARVRDRLKEIGILKERTDRPNHRIYFRIDWDAYETFAASGFDAPPDVQQATAEQQRVMDLKVPVQRKDAPPYAKIYAYLAEKLPDLKRRSAPARDRNIKRFWSHNRHDFAAIEKLVANVTQSDYLNSRNGHKFSGRLDLNWIFDPPKAEKIMEGDYDNERMTFALEQDAPPVSMLVRVWLEADRKVGTVPQNQIGEGKQFIEVGTDERSGYPKVVRVA